MRHPSHTAGRTLALAAASAVIATAARAQAPASTVTLPPLKVVDPAMIDSTTRACTNFFQYATGAWLKHDTIPAAYASSGVGRDMGDRNELVVRSVLEDAARRRAQLPATSTERKLGTYYATCMDSAAAERQGLDPLRPALAHIAAVSTRAALLDEVARLHGQYVNVLFRYRPDVALHDAAHYQAQFFAGGLGLPWSAPRRLIQVQTESRLPTWQRGFDEEEKVHGDADRGDAARSGGAAEHGEDGLGGVPAPEHR